MIIIVMAMELKIMMVMRMTVDGSVGICGDGGG